MTPAEIALLIADRNGGFITSSELGSTLFKNNVGHYAHENSAKASAHVLLRRLPNFSRRLDGRFELIHPKRDEHESGAKDTGLISLSGKLHLGMTYPALVAAVARRNDGIVSRSEAISIIRPLKPEASLDRVGSAISHIMSGSHKSQYKRLSPGVYRYIGPQSNKEN